MELIFNSEYIHVRLLHRLIHDYNASFSENLNTCAGVLKYYKRAQYLTQKQQMCKMYHAIRITYTASDTIE